MKRFFGVFLNDEGRLKSGWRLAVGFSAYALAFYGVLWLANAVFGALFSAWGLTDTNLTYAPVWAQQIVLWHTDFTYALAYGLSLLAACALTGSNRRKVAPENIVASALMGAGVGAMLTLLAFGFDSMRLEWPLCEASFSLRHVSALVILLLGSLSGEALTKWLAYETMRKRYGRGAGYAAVIALSMLLSGAWSSPLGIVNAALLGIVGCAVYERGGMMASAALTAGWSAWTTWLFAWPDGGAVSVYRMYTVSEAWLTGGNAGADAGVGAMIGWMIIAAILLRSELKSGIVRLKKERITNEQDSHCNRRSGLSR